MTRMAFLAVTTFGRLLSFILVLELFSWVASRPVDSVIATGRIEGFVTPRTASDIRPLVGSIWDLSFCGNGLKLRLGGKQVNRALFIFTSLDAARFAPLTYGENIVDRVYVWCRTALLFSSLTDKVMEWNIEHINKFQGDVILSRDNVDLVLAPYFPTDKLRAASYEAARSHARKQTSTGARRTKRKILPWSLFYWNNALIRYKFGDKKLTADDKAVIRDAMNHWEANTCIRFIQTDRIFFQPHLNFQKKDGCWSFIGQQFNGQQISIGRGCSFMGIVAHEIGHAIGFYHEQSRPDRDRYISLNKANIIPRMLDNFAKMEWSAAKTDGVPYDYSSIMHYKATDFSPKGKEIAMEATDTEMQKVMGQREYLSFLDVKLANLNYCKRVCGTKDLEWDQCDHAGYRDPNNCKQCTCPRGFAPPRCRGPAKGINAKCGKQSLAAIDTPSNLLSPGYNGAGVPSRSTCFWLIKASSPEKAVKLVFTGKFNFTDNPTLCEDYVEIRYKRLELTGPRFCGREILKKEFVSHGHEMLIITHSLKVNYWQGFQAQYVEGQQVWSVYEHLVTDNRTEVSELYWSKTIDYNNPEQCNLCSPVTPDIDKCGGCSVDAGGDEPMCLRSVKYDCAEEYKTTCQGSACVQQRENYCFREEEFCCDPFVATGSRCMRVGSRFPSVIPRPEVKLQEPDTTTTSTTTAKPTTTTTTTTPTTTTTITTTPSPTTTTTTTPKPTTTTTTTTPRPTTTTTTTPQPTTTTATTTTPRPTTTTTTATTTTPRPSTTTTTTPRPTTTTTTTPKPATTTTTTTPRPTTTTTTTPQPTTTTTTTTPRPTTTPPTTTPSPPAATIPTTTTPRTTTTTFARVLAPAPPSTKPVWRPYVPYTPPPPLSRGVWGLWTSWSGCSATCGLCGKQTRTRKCSIDVDKGCGLGDSEETRPCGASTCPSRLVMVSRIGHRMKKLCKPSAGWWFNKGTDCQETYTYFEEQTTERCCLGTPAIDAICRV